MAFVKASEKQTTLAKFLVDEGNNRNSPLCDEIFLENKEVYQQLLGIVEGGEYNGHFGNEINHVIDKLDNKHNGYITKNWKGGK